jgi:hypothetical protein
VNAAPGVTGEREPHLLRLERRTFETSLEGEENDERETLTELGNLAVEFAKPMLGLDVSKTAEKP